MTGDRVDLPKIQPESTGQAHEGLGDWLSKNVLNPFVDGTGIIQIYDTVTNHPLDNLLPTDTHKTGSLGWAVQSLSSTAGAIVPFVVAGKLTGMGMSAVGERFGIEGAAGRLLASDSVAQIAGAGWYEALQKPGQGETRIGNAFGTMAGFAAFEGGNRLIAKSSPAFSSGLAKAFTQGIGRLTVGASGGLVSYETSNYVSSLFGQPNRATLDGALNSMASGGLMNFALPSVQRGASKVIDLAMHGKSQAAPPASDTATSQSGSGSGSDLTTRISARESTGGSSGSRLIGESSDEFSRGATALDARTVKPYGSDSSSVIDLANKVEPSQPPGTLKPLNLDLSSMSTEHLSFRDPLARFTTETAPAIKPLKAPRMFVVDPSEPETGKVVPLAKPGEGATGASAEVKAEQPVAEGAKPGQVVAFDKTGHISPDPTIKVETPAHSDATAVVEAKDHQVVPFDRAHEGTPDVLGATVTDKGINFAIKSEGATKMELLIFGDKTAKQPTEVLPMYQTGDVWHRFEANLPSGTQYLYRAEGPYTPAQDGSRFNSNKVLLDPEALAITGDNPKNETGELGYDNTNPSDPNRDKIPSKIDNVEEMPRAIALRSDFDWTGDHKPDIPMQDAIIYELNVRAFTAADPKLGPLQGSYRGLMAKIPYLKDLGVTSVELMPVFKFDRADSNRVNPITGEQLYNAWGYGTTSFKAPEGRLAADGTLGEQVNEFKDMVKTFHDNNMEVLLDVVFNHTREGDQYGPTLNFRGLGNNTYYMLDPRDPSKYVDHTGCGNTFNTNDPVVMDYIMRSLKYWVQDMHVDGFRFDLAPIFKYMPDGTQQAESPILKAIDNDPVLSKVKLIAEPWSIDQYYLGKFADKMWAEWNGAFRDVTRKFIKSDPAEVGNLADRVDGSPSMFDETKGRNSVNFVTAHDGFTMRDLVSYNDKHNLANGENNRDGTNDNNSWNGGYEGPVDKAPLSDAEKATIEQLRVRQQKNLTALLQLSRGTPMMLYGDEIRRSQLGNNNAYNQEKLIEMPWDQLEANADQFNFTKMMIALRKAHNIGWSNPDTIVWHGPEVGKPDWSPESRTLAWQISPPNAKPLYIAFNAYWDPIEFHLPEGNWKRLMDTNLPSGQDVMASKDAPTVTGKSYWLNGRSAIVLEAADPPAAAPEAKK